MFDVASIIADHQRTLGRRETEEGEAYVLRLTATTTPPSRTCGRPAPTPGG
jgi:hypothetical protein